jgi:penicillin-binding protein 1A
VATSPDKASNPGGDAPPAPPRRKRFSFIRFFILLSVSLAIFFGALGYWGYKQFERDLPDRWSELTDYKPARASRVFSSEGELIGEFYLQKRVVLRPADIPRHVQQAFVAAEDNRFFDHHGIDPLGIARAAFANLKAGRVVQGGSTITQQVAKLMLVGGDRNLFRKIREAILAHKIERRLTKEQILSIYLNHIYLGHGAYGIQTAAEVYFAKDAKDLSIAEAAMLGGLPKAPTEDSPFSSFKRARDRQRYVLGQMLENGFISAGDYDAAMQEPIAIVSKDTPLNHLAAPYFVEHVRRIVQAKYAGKDLYDRGLRIHTTLVMQQQRAAELAVRHGLDDVDRRFGFRGPVARLSDAERETFVQSMPRPYMGPKEAALGTTAGALVLDRPYLAMFEPKHGRDKPYARLGALRVVFDDGDAAKIEHWLQKRGNKLEPGDLIPVRIQKIEVTHGEGKRRVVEEVQVARLAQQPDIQASLVALDPANGHLTAMVGGYDYNLSQFNRATQAKRQVGSSIKPYIYATALEHGFTEVTIVPDAPISVKTAAGFWSPHNYKGEYLGPITLRTALQHSINTVCVRLVVALGVDKVIEGIRRFGITAQIVRHPSVALGTPEVPLIEHAYGYATFPAGGLEVTPVLITKIIDADGNVVEEHKAPAVRKRRIPADTAYVMVDMMKNVVEKGTGQKAKELGRPAAGKTGTSNDFKDNWFMAYTRDLLCGVWVGRDDFKSIGYNATGGTTAAPIWTEFMKAAHPATPVRDFDAPTDVYFVRATADKGLPARPGTPNSVMLPFKRGTLPAQFTKVARAPGDATFSDDVF